MTGRLDLSGAELLHTIHFRDCVFEERVNLEQAQTRCAVEWEGGRLPGIIADRFESEADFIVRGVEVAGTVSLHWANVGGDLRFTDSHLVQPGGRAVNAGDVRVGGTLFLDGEHFHAVGEVFLRSGHVTGDVNCRHARFDNRGGRSIDAAHLVVDGELLCERGFRSDGEVCLQWAQVQRLRATGGSFASDTAYALHADALRALAGVYLDREFRATATVRLVGANITGELCCTEGTFENPSDRALNAERLVADDVYLDRGFTAKGEVRFTDAVVKRQFNATNGKFYNDHAEACALNADGLICGGEVYLNEGFHAAGAVSLTGAAITGQLNCTAGIFDNRDGYALFADGLTTPGMVYLDKGFRAIGEVRFARSTVGRQLDCTDGTFDNQHAVALDLTGVVCQGDVLLKSTGSDGTVFRATGEVRIRGARIARDLDVTNASMHGGEGFDGRGMRVGGRLIWKLDTPPEGEIKLSRAQIDRLEDTRESWPDGHYKLTGMSYQTVSGLTIEQRKDWLKHTRVYSPDAYRQLAQVYQQEGRQPDSQEILIANQRDLRDKKRGQLNWRSRAWSRFIDISVGYGYKLHRPFAALLVAGLAGGVIFLIAQHANLILATGDAHRSAMAAPPAGTPPFYPFPYSFQLLIPGIDLRETANWLPDAAKSGWGLFMMIWMWVMIVFGWVLATAVVAGITRLFRQR